MNPLNSIDGTSPAVRALLLLGAAVVVVVLWLLLASRSRAPRSARERPGPWRAIAGALVVAFVLQGEVRGILAGGAAPGRSLPARIEDPRPEGDVDRIQVLCFRTDHAGVLLLEAIGGDVVPWIEGRKSEVVVEALDARITLADRAPQGRSLATPWFEVSVRDDWTMSGSGAGAQEFDPGDGRPFRSLASFQPTRAPLRLRDVRDEKFSVWVRELREGERLAEVSERDLIERAERAHVAAAAFALVQDPARATFEGPIPRLLSELQPMGTLLFLGGLALALFARVSLARGAALTLLALVLAAGAAARLEHAVWTDGIASEDPAERRVAAAGLARSRAYAVSSAEALARAYEAEPDETRRAATLVIVAAHGNPMRVLPAARALVASAKASPIPELRRLAETIEGEESSR